MQPHSTNHDYKLIHLEDYTWDNFSFLDSLKHKIHLLFVWLFCTFFKSHDWIILVDSWTVSDITTVQEFRKYQAKLLQCSCCNTIKHVNDANLTQAEMFAYQHRTYKYFNRKE